MTFEELFRREGLCDATQDLTYSSFKIIEPPKNLETYRSFKIPLDGCDSVNVIKVCMVLLAIGKIHCSLNGLGLYCDGKNLIVHCPIRFDNRMAIFWEVTGQISDVLTPNMASSNRSYLAGNFLMENIFA